MADVSEPVPSLTCVYVPGRDGHRPEARLKVAHSDTNPAAAGLRCERALGVGVSCTSLGGCEQAEVGGQRDGAG